MAEINKLNNESAKYLMEAEKLRAKTIKMQKEAKWYPWLPLAVAVLALAVALLK